eukprot:359868-Rhodomonas_salina.1
MAAVPLSLAHLRCVCDKRASGSASPAIEALALPRFRTTVPAIRDFPVLDSVRTVPEPRLSLSWITCRLDHKCTFSALAARQRAGWSSHCTCSQQSCASPCPFFARALLPVHAFRTASSSRARSSLSLSVTSPPPPPPLCCLRHVMVSSASSACEIKDLSVQTVPAQRPMYQHRGKCL